MARDLDQKFHNTKPGDVGLIEAKFSQFGARDRPNVTLNNLSS